MPPQKMILGLFGFGGLLFALASGAFVRRLGDLADNELEGLVHQRLRELLDEEEGPLSSQEKLLIVRQIGDSVLGLGPLEPYVRDPEVTEIMVNNWDTIYVERSGKLFWTGTKLPAKEIPIGTYRCSSCGYLESYAK